MPVISPYVAHAGVDGGDHAQRNVQRVEHRALLDVDFDKALVVGRVAADGANSVHVQPRFRHGVAHGDTVCVRLVQPGGVKVASECARAQKGGFVALAFFFGKGHYFQRVGQALASGLERLHAGQGHVNAQPTVVLATVAHGVIVAAGEQGFG